MCFAQNEIKSVSSAAADFITLVISSRKGFHSFPKETDLIANKAVALFARIVYISEVGVVDIGACILCGLTVGAALSLLCGGCSLI